MQETLNRKVTENGLAKQQLRQNATFHKFSATFFNEMFSFHDILIFFILKTTFFRTFGVNDENPDPVKDKDPDPTKNNNPDLKMAFNRTTGRSVNL